MRMKFRGRMMDPVAIKRFYSLLNSMAKLCRTCVLRLTPDKFYLVAADLAVATTGAAATRIGLGSGRSGVWAEAADQSAFFHDYCLEGVTKEDNEIHLELEPDKLAKNLSVLRTGGAGGAPAAAFASSSTARSLKVKLTRRLSGGAPCLSFEIELSGSTATTAQQGGAPAGRQPPPATLQALRRCTHDVPVLLVPRKHWAEYRELPTFRPATFDVVLSLPELRRLKHIADNYRNLGSVASLKASRSGDLTVSLESNDHVSVGTHFKGLDVVVVGSSSMSGNGDHGVDDDLTSEVRVDLRRLSLLLGAEPATPRRIMMGFVEGSSVHVLLVCDELSLQFILPAVSSG